MSPYELRAKAYLEGRELTQEEWKWFHREMRKRTEEMTREIQEQGRRQRVTPEMLNRVIDL